MQRVFRWLRRMLPRDFSGKYRWNLNPDKQASQGGEDGIIQEIFARLDIERGWFVEFGAWDGVRYSNTFALAQRGWHGMYIEGDPEKAVDLQRNMQSWPRVIPICRYISLKGDDRLDAILAQGPLPQDFELLSIDIDGNDYWIWKSLTDYTPKVVVIEYNSNFGPQESKAIPYDANHRWDGTLFYGASAAALNDLAEAKGYTLVAYTPKLNLFFVRSDLVEGRFEPLQVEKVPTGKLHIQRRREDFIDV